MVGTPMDGEAHLLAVNLESRVQSLHLQAAVEIGGDLLPVGDILLHRLESLVRVDLSLHHRAAVEIGGALLQAGGILLHRLENQVKVVLNLHLQAQVIIGTVAGAHLVGGEVHHHPVVNLASLDLSLHHQVAHVIGLNGLEVGLEVGEVLPPLVANLASLDLSLHHQVAQVIGLNGLVVGEVLPPLLVVNLASLDLSLHHQVVLRIHGAMMVGESMAGGEVHLVLVANQAKVGLANLANLASLDPRVLHRRVMTGATEDGDLGVGEARHQVGSRASPAASPQAVHQTGVTMGGVVAR